MKVPVRRSVVFAQTIYWILDESLELELEVELRLGSVYLVTGNKVLSSGNLHAADL